MDIDKKIIVSDYDNTFYLNSEDIEKNKVAVKDFRKNGNIFVIATGRSYSDFYIEVNKYNIKYDYLILNHGATILDKNNNIIYNFSIKNEIIQNIKNDLQLEKAYYTFCCSELESRVDFEHEDITKINIQYNSIEDARNICETIIEKYHDFVNAYLVSEKILEIISKEINKSKAINLLLNEIETPKQNVYTIGDGYSDIGMVKDFNGFAMKDSVDELKQIAKKEYDSLSQLIYEII